MLGIALLALSACQEQEGGSFSVNFVWAEEPTEVVWLSMAVEERSDVSVPGPVLASNTPQPFVPGTALELSLGSVSYGSNRVLIVEGRLLQDPGTRAMWYGLSPPFDLVPGRHVTVEVPLALNRPKPDTEDAGLTLVVGDVEAPEAIGPNDLQSVALRLTQEGAKQAFLANGPDLALGRLELDLDNHPQVACSPVDTGSEVQRCDYQGWDLSAGLASPPAHGDVLAVYVAYVDAWGYPGAIHTASTLYDTEPPALETAVTFTRADGRDVAQVAPNEVWSTRFSVVQVNFLVDEALAELPVVTAEGVEVSNLSMDAAGTQVTFDLVEGPEVATDVTVSGTLVDQAGNAVQLELGTVRYDYDAPDWAGALQPLLFHYRAPWGTHETEGKAVSDVRLCTPSDPSSAPWSACQDALPVDIGFGGELVFTSGTTAEDAGVEPCSMTPLVRSLVEPTESLSLSLPVDQDRVCVQVLDLAGNTSATTLLRHGTWLATLQGKVVGDESANPHRLIEVPSVRGTRDQGVHATEVTTDGLFGALAPGDGQSLTVSTRRAWTGHLPSDTAPSRYGGAQVRDPVTGNILSWGGRSTLFGVDVLGDLDPKIYQWNDSAWLVWTPELSPNARRYHSWTWDPVHDRAVMFGGVDITPQARGDIWEWREQEWSEIVPEGGVTPAVRYSHSAVYDPVRGRVLVYGGTDTNFALKADLWSLNGSRWEMLDDGVDGPAARFGAHLAYDVVRDRLLLFGGSTYSGTDVVPYDELWEWRESGWRLVGESGDNWPWVGGLAYHPLSDSVLNFGFEDLQQWEAKTWSLIPFDPGCCWPRWERSALWNATTGGFSLTGTTLDVDELQLVEWIEGDQLRPRRASSQLPARLYLAGMAWDSSTDSLLLTGGRQLTVDAAVMGAGDISGSGEVWRFQYGGWALAEATDTVLPTARLNHASAPSPDGLGVVVFGGIPVDCTTQATWPCPLASGTLLRQDGTWSTNPSWDTVSPPERVAHRMVRVTHLDKVLLFGGWTPSQSPAVKPHGDMWLLDEDGWEEVPMTPGVFLSRGALAMAYDSLRQKVVFFGGRDKEWAGLALDDTWEWDGEEHHKVNTGPTAIAPSPRSGSAMVFNPERGRTVLYGGGGVDPADGALVSYADTWEWTGFRWLPLDTLGDPGGLGDHSMAYDPAEKRITMFGGNTEGAASPANLHTWHLETSPDLRPGVLGVFKWAYEAVARPEEVQGLKITVRTGGQGNTLQLTPDANGELVGAPVPGAQLLLWDAWSGGWVTVASNQAGPDAPATLVYESPTGWHARRFLGADGRLRLRVQPSTPDGNGLAPAQVSLDDLEVMLDYGLSSTGDVSDLCVSDCAARACGDDGCGGSCGECGQGEVCTESGGCLAPSMHGWLCDADHYDSGDGCDCSCGILDPDCAVSAGPLFGCPTGDFSCDASGACVCPPACDGKACGPDGCGAECGLCDEGAFCDSEGQCVPEEDVDFWTCPESWYEDSWCDCGCGVLDPVCAEDPDAYVYNCPWNLRACSAEGGCVCKPECDGVEACGSDGCGGVCNTCSESAPFCSDGACVEACEPDCTNKVCGDDGCGGSCGDCSAGTCVTGICSDGLLGAPCEDTEQCAKSIDGITYICAFGFCTALCTDLEPEDNQSPCETASADSAHGESFHCYAPYGYCFPGAEHQWCDESDDCSTELGEVCAWAFVAPDDPKDIIGLCVTPAEWKETPGGPCEVNQDCQSGTCWSFSNGTECQYHCASQEDCPDGRLCLGMGFVQQLGDTENSFWAGHCRAWEGSAVPCEGQADCSEGEFCDAILVHDGAAVEYYCRTEFPGTEPVGATCTDATECANNWCFSLAPSLETGFCTLSCPGGDADCGEGTHCWPDHYVHGNVTPWDASDDVYLGLCVPGETGDLCKEGADLWCASDTETCTASEALPDGVGMCQAP